jgi:predicted nucleic acid-binding Zn ribbon protein
MARWRDWDDDDPGMVHGPEDEDWPDDRDDEPTMPCPRCGREILEDAERCPYCERYLSKEDAPRPRKPWWIIIGVVACLCVVYLWNARW